MFWYTIALVCASSLGTIMVLTILGMIKENIRRKNMYKPFYIRAKEVEEKQNDRKK